ncbi:hypothetical protein ACKUB1_13845 [Methanospirillum stamsii]|uniref:Phage major capsid protein n=1 Tax=Methanospirillum stamsii TaxID=1277351 RepID=A0A2V2NHK8_9EURY|nr:hypothetical protein [Methanospirillum stamsii]PWR74813.1 hypothetical protein DLD82_07915 [Methanospirillum stamsii]
MPGIITAADISGSLDAKNIVLGVLEQANAQLNLGSLFTHAQVLELTATIPISKPGSVHEDLDELEVVDVETGSFTYVDFSLKKDRVYLARTDEAQYKSKAGDPLAIQKQSAANELNRTLDKKIITALQTSPQTADASAVWSTATNSPLKDIATAVAAIYPNKPDFCLMTGEVHAAYLATDAIKAVGTGNPAALAGCVGTIPGYNIPIFIDSTTVTDESCTIGSAAGLACVIGDGPVKVREWDSNQSGATMYQIDVWRQVKAPIFKNGSNLNTAVYKLTNCVA